MLRDRLIDVAVRFGIDEQLRTVRDILPRYRGNYAVDHTMHLLLESLLKPTSNCIDVGAYRGKVLGEIVRLAPHGSHIAYEPQPDRYKYLVNHFPFVDVRMAALSNEEGETSFTQVKNLPGYSGLREISYPRSAQIEKLTVRTETLDGNLPAGYVPSLIKIDVEGAEGLVIEGGIKTISEYKPTIIFEHGKAGADYYNTQPRHIYELLHDEAGLRIFDLDGNGPYSLDQFEGSCGRDERWDYIARL